MTWGDKNSRCLHWTAHAYLALVISALVVIRFGGDRWWPVTILLYAPRWLALLPLIVLLPLAVWRCRRSLLPLLLGALLVVGPLMGLCLPHGTSAKPAGSVLRVISCNINNGDFRADALASLVRETRADIVSLQEHPAGLRLKLPPGWQMVEQGGLAVLSHLPLRLGSVVQVFNPPNPWPATCLLHCIVAAPGGDLDVCSLQLPTPRFGLLSVLDKTTLVRPSRKGLLIQETAYRARASAEVQRAVAAMARPLIIAGDFNMPVDSAIYRTHWSRYRDGFSRSGRGYGFTQRVTVKGLRVAVRIDHILTGADLYPCVCEVGADVGSDHLPLIADIARR